jgi:hypothetical protein
VIDRLSTQKTIKRSRVKKLRCLDLVICARRSDQRLAHDSHLVEAIRAFLPTFVRVDSAGSQQPSKQGCSSTRIASQLRVVDMHGTSHVTCRTVGGRALINQSLYVSSMQHTPWLGVHSFGVHMSKRSASKLLSSSMLAAANYSLYQVACVWPHGQQTID